MLTARKLIDYVANNNIKLDTPIMGIDDYNTLILMEINGMVSEEYQETKDIIHKQILTLRDI